MINILFISQYLNVGGTETFMMNILRNIDKSKFHIDFLVFSKESSSYSQEAEALGSTIYRLPDRRCGIKYYYRLNIFFRQKANNYHVIHFCGGNVSSIAPVYFANKYHIPIRIIHSHSSSCDGFHNKVFHSINRLLLPKLSTHFFACSTKAASFFFRNHKCTIIKNGIDVRKYAYSKERRQLFRSNYNIAKETHVIGHIGRFETVKNHNMILDIFRSYHILYPDSLLVLVGSGTLFKEVKAKVNGMGLSDKVLFLGERNDIPEILCSMDCFLMPSLYEGLPFVLIEAQTSGVPCIVSDTINQDVKIIPYLCFLSLKEHVNTWTETINEVITDRKRVDAVRYVSNAGYDILSTVKYLESTYISDI